MVEAIQLLYSGIHFKMEVRTLFNYCGHALTLVFLSCSSWITNVSIAMPRNNMKEYNDQPFHICTPSKPIHPVSLVKVSSLGAHFFASCGYKIIINTNFDANTLPRILYAYCLVIRVAYAFLSSNGVDVTTKVTTEDLLRLSESISDGLMNAIKGDWEIKAGGTTYRINPRKITSCFGRAVACIRKEKIERPLSGDIQVHVGQYVMEHIL